MTDSSSTTRSPHEPATVVDHSRREVLKSAVTLGLLAGACGAVLPSGVSALDSAQGVNALTMFYPRGDFDFDYYRSKYLTTLRSAYGAAVERVELRKMIPRPGQDPAILAFSATINIWIKDLTTFLSAHREHGEALASGARHFTNVEPVIQFDKFHGAMGVARSAPQIGERCLMMLYPNGESVRWDVDNYRTTQMPLIMKLYGPKAIRRFEVRKGDRGQAPGSRPTYIGLVSLYVADQAAMQAAGREHGRRLMAEHASFTNVDPVVFPSLIEGIG